MKITDETYRVVAMQFYDNPCCTGTEEFDDDLLRIKYIKRSIKKYLTSGVLNDRLIINHIISFVNVFGIQGALVLLFHRMEHEYLPVLRTFLLYLEYISDDGLKEKLEAGIDIPAYPINREIIERLNEL